MEIKNFTITKRDGSKDRFSLDKIMNAIVKAFESVEEELSLRFSATWILRTISRWRTFRIRWRKR